MLKYSMLPKGELADGGEFGIIASGEDSCMYIISSNR